jgi:hypothetical protein
VDIELPGLWKGFAALHRKAKRVKLYKGLNQMKNRLKIEPPRQVKGGSGLGALLQTSGAP